jgi:hypothetical protein
MKIGDLVKVQFGAAYLNERLGIVVNLKKWNGVREVKVQFTDGQYVWVSPLIVKKVE